MFKSRLLGVPIIVFIAILIVSILIIITLQIKEHYNDRDPMIKELKVELADVHPGIKNSNVYVGNRSYTINKENMFLCLKDEKGRYYDKNQLVYVFLHEYAHILCNEIGHTDRFYQIFDELLQKAEKLGKYDPKIPPIKGYCEY